VLDWAETVREVALDLAPLIAERKSLDFGLDADQPTWVRGHEWALRELTRNLLHNAIKHSPRRRRAVGAPGQRWPHAALTVADSGPGLAPELRERLFQPFAVGVAATPGRAAGLGLAICHEIVDARWRAR
jgi:two-component system sensor histidine kinase TctE